MRAIRISDPVWDTIAKHGKFGESADDVLRRVFGIGSANSEGRPTGTGRKGRGNKRFATKRMSSGVANGNLIVSFENGPSKRWKLPSPTNKLEIKHIRDEAIAFAKENGATDPGQTNAVRKALTDNGYHLTR